MRPPLARPSLTERCLTSGASVGAAVVGVLTLLHASNPRPVPHLAVAEILLLKLLGSAPEVTFRPAFFIFAHGGYVYLLAVLALLVWRRTRPWAVTGLAVVTGCAAAWVAAMACGLAYILNPTLGLLPAWVALPIAAVLASWRRWRPASSIVLAAGLALGTLLAQAFYAFPFQDAQDQFVSPLWGFVPPVTLAVIIAPALCLRRPAHSDAGWLRKLVGHWGLMGCSIACVVFFVTEFTGARVREAEPAGSRILNDWAYDVTITGEPPQLVWTDRQRIQVLTDAYGETHERYTLDDEFAYYVQRIWPSPVGGFHLDAMDAIDWWNVPPPGERLSYRPTVRYRVDSWLRQRGTDSSSVWTLAEDPVGRRTVHGQRVLLALRLPRSRRR